ncbi:hypothetical protein CRI77_23375 [Mycolicibacterium duvalii]|uniref:Uncharacterized protein n=1 Tax=Mycolicibacterium duvalii TaxID=39688 RepID=A0A7I7JWN7_9MYCO|nr:hypothetical protein [Mycolicibacterium duvalii]PEG36307.1 hypothetical protein CRI77_23375 [Mycolicibacterium duvalii]BBX15502.1 hypothetical protein MDUV_03620 [Mycolicibacterium duvalii]
MAKRRAPRKRAAARDPLPAPRRIEAGADGADYEVRPVSAANAAKTYRCPGCDHEIRPATAHIVAWPVDGIEDRRHWHTSCWRNRTTRGPTRKWS